MPPLSSLSIDQQQRPPPPAPATPAQQAYNAMQSPNQFYGQGDLAKGVVILDQSYELHTPLSTHPTIWTDPRAKLTFAETTSGSDRVDRWSSKALEPTVDTTVRQILRHPDRVRV